VDVIDQELDPDLALMDVNLPGINGLEVRTASASPARANVRAVGRFTPRAPR